jgi:tRNA-specific 2-thiouridylase
VYPCVAWLAGGKLVINLRAPARAVAAGQAAVLYDGDTVLGSATISAAR